MAQKTGMTGRQGATRANKGPAKTHPGTIGQPKLTPPRPAQGKGSGRASSGLKSSPSAGSTGPSPAMTPGKSMVVRGGAGTSHQGAGEAKGHAGFTKHTRKPA